MASRRTTSDCGKCRGECRHGQERLGSASCDDRRARRGPAWQHGGTAWWQPLYLTWCWHCSCSSGPPVSGGTPCSTPSCSCTLWPHSPALGASASLARTPPAPTCQTIAPRAQARARKPAGTARKPAGTARKRRRHSLRETARPEPASSADRGRRAGAGLRNRPRQLSGGAA